MPDDARNHPFGRHGNHRANGHRNGSSPEGMRTRPVPMDDVREPLDMVAVQADDELINALSAGLPVTAPGRGGYDADDHLAAMLAAWKSDVDADPIPEIDLDAAVGAVVAGRRPSGRTRHLVPIASAAALIVVAITGVSIAAHDSRPGDPLFSVSKVLYSQEASSYEALATVQESQTRAKQALAVGDKTGAETALAQGQAAAANVLAEHGRGEVEQELHKLKVVVDDSQPGVPTVVKDDEDKPAHGGRHDKEDPGTGAQRSTTSTTTSPTSPTSTHEPSSSTGHGGTDSARSGDERSASSGTDKSSQDESRPAPESASGPGSEPKPDSRSGQTGPPPPGSSGGESSTGSSGQDSSTKDRSKQPAETSSSAPSPNTTYGSQSSSEQRGQFSTGSPQTSKAPVSNGTNRRPPWTSGISGASMSATGTATPSGEPTN